MDSFDKYAEYTKAQDWAAICKLNNIELDSFGTKKELKALPSYLEPDEVVFALTSGVMDKTETSNSFDFGSNTWLVVLTSERFLFLDAAMLTSSVDSQSVRLDKVQAVSSSQGWIFGKVSIDLGSRMIVVDNCMKATVKSMAELANRWLKELSNQTRVNHAPIQNAVEESPLDKLEKLAQLHSAGILSVEEFAEAKQKILSSL